VLAGRAGVEAHLVPPEPPRREDLRDGRAADAAGLGAGRCYQDPRSGGKAMRRQLAAIIEREADGYVASCPELDIASQGSTVEEARRNLQEALELFFEAASAEEIRQQLRDEVYVSRALPPPQPAA
jgi:predicted RNase H-like HicB family nuclease